MDDKTVLLIGAGALAFIFIFNTTNVFASEVKPAAGQSGFVTKELTAISGADWSLPLFLTVERSIPLGIYGLDTLFSVASTVASGVGTGLSYVGSAIGDALATANQVVTGTVIPAVINATGTTATYVASGAQSIYGGLTTGASYVGSGLQWIGGEVVDLGKAAGGAIVTGVTAIPGVVIDVGKNVWDFTKVAGGYVWDAVTGTFKFVKDNSAVIGKAAAAVAGLVAATSIKPNNVSDNTTNTQQATGGSIGGPAEPQLIPLGYLSKTNFEDPKAMIVKKLYNPKVNDTRVVTDQNTYDVAVKVGYEDRGSIGYCSPQPFYGAVNMYSLYNPNIIDSIIVTNIEAVKQLEKQGYQNLGTIGYCKAL